MSFDLERAVKDFLERDTNISQRLVSYLYFAGVQVLEQQLSDEFGSGVSVLGASLEEGRPGVLLAAPIPPPEPPKRRSLTEACMTVDLTAKAWAVAEAMQSQRGENILFLGYRPDPSGATLRDMVGAMAGALSRAFVFSAVGPSPVPVGSGVLAAWLTMPLLPWTRASMRLGGFRAIRMKGKSLWDLIGRLQKGADAGQFVPLHVFKRSLPPCAPQHELKVFMGFVGGDQELPASWIQEDIEVLEAGPWKWGEAARSLTAVVERASEVVRGLWRKAGRGPPKELVRVTHVEGTDAGAARFMVLWSIPPLQDEAQSEQGLVQRLVSAASAAGVKVEVVCVARGPGGEAAPWIPRCFSQAVLWSGGAFIADLVKECWAMGPDLQAVRADPVRAARELALAYVRALTSDVETGGEHEG